jgi:hypothetical protein
MNILHCIRHFEGRGISQLKLYVLSQPAAELQQKLTSRNGANLVPVRYLLILLLLLILLQVLGQVASYGFTPSF